MDKEQLRRIFIEEAGEIIENLDVQIIDFEENPTNKELLNDLFRGVHTLKGSANSFGFTRLGKYVHHFEDLLDYHRGSDGEISSQSIDIFLEAVDMVKEMFSYEIEGKEDMPNNYQSSLNKIKNALNKEEEPQVQEIEKKESKPIIADITAEFTKEYDAKTVSANEKEKALLDSLKDDEKLCLITLNLDNDIYFRGYDHTTFLILLSQTGRILESYWDMQNIPMLDEFDGDKCYIKTVDIYFAFKCSIEEVKEIFEYIDEDEFKITVIEKTGSKKQEEKPQIKETVKIQESKDEELQEKPKDSDSKIPSSSSEKRSFLKIETTKLDELFDSVGELVIAQNFLNENPIIKNIGNEHVEKTMETLSKITRLIQSRVMGLRMVPIRDIFDKMKRVVRDASKKVNKEIEFKTFGEDTEIDKTMIDKLSDPLIHLVRNAIDHGMEATSEDRIKAGKEAIGTVTLGAYHKGGNVVIEISDNGRGINKEVVLAKAIKNGLIEENHPELSEQQIFNFIMQPGFSTAAVISDISGRGVGLDVVRNFIENMRGRIEIESKLGEGSVFKIMLPLTLAIIDGMLVKSSDEIFIIPTLSVIESFRPTKEIVHTAQGKGEYVRLREDLLPVVRLNKKLGLSDEMHEITASTLVCVENEGGKFAILVDELIGRQQVVIKSLGKSMSKIKEISGGAVMGNGEVALILNIDGIAV